MTADDLRSIEVYCTGEKCGDPVSGLTRTTAYTKRRMVSAGTWNLLYAKYRCPHCPTTRFFRRSFGGGDHVEVKKAEAEVEVRAMLVVVVLGGLLLWGSSALKQASAARAVRGAQEEQQALAQVAAGFRQYLDVTPESGRVDRNGDIVVVMAVKLRGAAQVDSAVFVPVSGYLIDQDGTRFDPRVTPADGTRWSVDAPGAVIIVPDQIYRYYLVAAIPFDPTSDVLPRQRKLTRLVLYLPGGQPQEVPLGLGA